MTGTYNPGHPIWCAGCGHFGVRGAITHVLENAGIPLHEAMVLAGIGCSGTVQNNVGAYGYHAMHGRVVPTAIGASMANPELTVIAAAGDGDAYAIGAGHLVHAFKRNPNILYVVMNNGVYGLTKGQESPTTEFPKDAPQEDPLDAILLGLSIHGSTFLARGITTRSTQLHELMLRGLEHVREGRGMAFLELLSPCVTYHDAYPEWMSRIHDVDADPEYSHEDRGAAFAAAQRLVQQRRIPIGLMFRGQHVTLQDSLLGEVTPVRALDAEMTAQTRAHMDSVLSAYAV